MPRPAAKNCCNKRMLRAFFLIPSVGRGWPCWPKRWTDKLYEVPRRLGPARCGRLSPCNALRPTSSPTLKLWMDVSGSVRRAQSISAGTFRSRSRSWFGRPRASPNRTCSTRKSGEPLGSRSRAGTSSAKKTTPCILTWNGSLRNACATTTELDSSHVPMLSQPERVIDVIRAAANAVQKATVAA
jgi:hypothetical protein